MNNPNIQAIFLRKSLYLSRFTFFGRICFYHSLNGIGSMTSLNIPNSLIFYIKSLETDWPLWQHLQNYGSLIDMLHVHVTPLSLYKDVIVLGTGGSSLGGQALCALAKKHEPSEPSPHIHFLSNIDPHTFKTHVMCFDPKTTAVISISKSGNTAETLMQTLTIIDIFKDKGFNPSDQMRIITEPCANAMHAIAAAYGIQTLAHPLDVGGRFSVFTVVGLLPALLQKIDGKSFCQGAMDTFQRTIHFVKGLTADKDISIKDMPFDGSSPLLGALSHAGFVSEGIDQLVIFVYADRLVKFADWFCQLWGESLGKKNQQGQSLGTTPIRSVGTIDQHSQLQLYLDGPRNKHFRVITLHNQIELSAPLDDTHTQFTHPALVSLKGRTMGDLMIAEQKATIDTLRAFNRPVSVIELDTCSPYHLGALMMHSMLETLALAHLWQINPFDQPAVEDGKKRALVYLKDM